VTVTTVTFDFWGTLVFDGPRADDRYRGMRLEEFARILAAAGTEVSGEALEAAYSDSGAFLAAIWDQNRDVPVTEHVAALLRALDPVLPARLPAGVLDQLVEAYTRPALAIPPVPDDAARTVLEALVARGYTLAVVSNTMRTPGAVLRKILERHGLLAHFRHATFSDEVGVRKPDPEIFALTLQAVGATPDTALHVGDHPVLDVEGARAAGMRVVQVTGMRSRRHTGGADAVIPRLAGLPAVLAALER
jgi:HAD superfamily hydrolase (TIGR01509 family)